MKKGLIITGVLAALAVGGGLMFANQDSTNQAGKSSPTPSTDSSSSDTTPISPTPSTLGSETDGVDYDCSDFSTHEEAQEYFESQGGSPSNNVDRLDRDRDGLACELN